MAKSGLLAEVSLPPLMRALFRVFFWNVNRMCGVANVAIVTATLHKSAKCAPAAGDKLLRGITVFDFRADGGIKHSDLPMRECGITRAEVASADEIWLCSSTKTIVPVITLDGAKVGTGTPGKHYRRARKAFDNLIMQAAKTDKL